MDNKLNIKSLVQTLHNKLNYLEQLKSEYDTAQVKIKKLEKIALFGNIVFINKKYHQFVGKRNNGKQEKVYIGKNEKKLQFYRDCIGVGKLLDKLLIRVLDINDEIEEFNNKINPKYF